MKTFKIVYYDPETDKYIHQTIKCDEWRMRKRIIYFVNTSPYFIILVLNTGNLISIEQVS